MSPSFLRLAAATLVAGALSSPAAAARAANGTCYGVSAAAVTASFTRVSVSVTTAAGCAAPARYERLRVTSVDRGGDLGEEVVLDASRFGATTVVTLGPVARRDRIEVEATLIGADGTATVLRRAVAALLGPDLAARRVRAPRVALGGRPITVRAELVEQAGDSGSLVTPGLFVGDALVATAPPIRVAAGRSVPVRFAGVSLAPGSVSLTVRPTNEPLESAPGNDAASAAVEVTEFMLAPSRVLVPALTGFGAQFNQHTYAEITAVPPDALPGLEAKVLFLDPQFVRIFYNDAVQRQFPDRLDSFVRTVWLAQRSGATINVTWQSGGMTEPEASMARFVDVLASLHGAGLTNVRWVTVQNEPNSTRITLAQYEAIWRALDRNLRARGLRDAIGLMGGDLVQDGQRAWLEYMGSRMSDVLDAYSIHVFWDYWDAVKIGRRLMDVRQIVDALPESGRKPLYVTEYGVRGIRNFNGVLQPDPGVWEDGVPIGQTTIAAFQHLWFDVVAAQLGYVGTVKWDCYYGRYDRGVQAHYVIGPPEAGWPLYPSYHALRLLTATTEPGWKVLATDEASPAPTRELAAFSGGDGVLTLVGIDTAGALLPAPSPVESTYSIAGLPASRTFRLVVWNLDGTGTNTAPTPVVVSPDGIASFRVPLHAAFALTTADVR